MRLQLGRAHSLPVPRLPHLMDMRGPHGRAAACLPRGYELHLLRDDSNSEASAVK